MTILTHFAVTFLLVKLVEAIFGIHLTGIETVIIVIIGNILDFDYLLARVLGINGAGHHGMPTHTFFGILAISLIVAVPLTFLFSPIVPILIFVSLLIHIIIDDSERFLYWTRIRNKPKQFEINWLYPFKNIEHLKENSKTPREYVNHMGNLFYFEIFSIFSAITILLASTHIHLI